MQLITIGEINENLLNQMKKENPTCTNINLLLIKQSIEKLSQTASYLDLSVKREVTINEINNISITGFDLYNNLIFQKIHHLDHPLFSLSFKREGQKNWIITECFNNLISAKTYAKNRLRLWKKDFHQKLKK